jgi:aryl-alcohol dehydrogenase-like predicted oxidoreductase
VRALAGVASDLGVTPAQLAIAWILRLPEVSSVITGATQVTQLEENVKAVEALPRLAPDVLERIEAIVKNKPMKEG